MRISAVTLSALLVIGCTATKPTTSEVKKEDSVKTFSAMSMQDVGKPPAGVAQRVPADLKDKVDPPATRPPRQAVISKEQALGWARDEVTKRVPPVDGTPAVLTVATLGTYGDLWSGKFTNPVLIDPGDVQKDDPVWIFRYRGNFKADRTFTQLTVAFDANTGSMIRHWDWEK